MDLWIWILLACVIVILFIVIAVTLRAIRPKAPEPLGTDFATPSSATLSSATPAAASSLPARRDPRPVTPGPLTPSVIAEIDALVAGEQKISAIKVLREHSRLSLREAKDQIDAWVPTSSGTMDPTPVSLARSDSRPAGAPSYAGQPSPSDAVAHLDPNVRAEIGRLIAAGQKISAIKLLREATGLGLKDSKDAIESWR